MLKWYKINKRKIFIGVSHPKTFHDQLKNLKISNENSQNFVKTIETTTAPEPVQQIKDTILKGKLIPEQQTSLKYFPFGT